MIVTLIMKSGIRSITLPEKIRGLYWLSDTDTDGHLRRVLSAEGIEQEWTLQACEYLVFLDANGKQTNTVRLQPDELRVVSAKYLASGEKVQIFAEPATSERQTFRKYCAYDGCELNIGRAPDNQIIFENKFVSSHHARLIYRDGIWSITDTQSSNGTFVNGKTAVMERLKPGDVIYIMGLKILIGGAFFAINNPDGCVRLETQAVYPFRPQAAAAAAASLGKPEPECFFRSPRFCRSISSEEIRVDAPPNREKVEEVPIALLLGPALTMGITAALMGFIAFRNLSTGASTLSSALPTIAMSFSMLCGTVLWPLLTKRNEKKKMKVLEQKRQSKYCTYLDGIRDHLFAISKIQTEILRENYPTLEECTARVMERRRNLWERSTEHADFLRLRLGTGSLPLTVDIHYPEQHFAMEDDNLMHDLARLEGEPKLLPDVPVTYCLREDSVSGILGAQGLVQDFARGLILQIAALHSYDEVKLVFLIDEEEMPAWEFVRWLPHIWADDRSVRFLATDEQEVRALSVHLERILADRIEALSKKAGRFVSQYVVIAVSRRLADKAEFFPKALAAPASAGFSCISLARELRELPKECSKVVELGTDAATVYDRNDLSGSRLTFLPETAENVDVETAAKALDNIELDDRSGHYQLPDLITFLEMYGVGKVEYLNAPTRWKENNPVNSLQAPVGLGTDGEPFMLDLHEKFHGPHGLVAGMTGSGKSEFIITFILSLALNYSPDEVAFILIDYKGGGLAGAFENAEKGVRLPHLAGTITNLDGAEVKRSLVSIQSELRRRQAIFNEARRISGEGTIDIYKYQKMYRSGQVSEAVPHLFIISDEFAELKTQQPEFMEQLISAARIGRSLGIHLILATQKPTGVVDDQIWSNSRFRVCLKVQERSDSMDMIKRPDAAGLTETGRFYLQVGFNEFFAMGQSAWCGAPYFPTERVRKNRDDSVAVIDHLGRIMAETRPKAGRQKNTGNVSQVVSIVDYLSQIAEEEHTVARRLWLPAIPAMICTDDLRKKYGGEKDAFVLSPVVGEYDDPFNQKQGLLTLELTREGNALVYGTAGSGKIMLLDAVLYDLLAHHNAEQMNLYLLDLGEETLKAFEKAPQVGGVLLSGDGERIISLFRMLSEEMARRKRLFADFGGDCQTYCRKSGSPVPQILTVIHNYSAFEEQFEQLEEPLLQLTREGIRYGICFLITASSPGAVRYRVTQNFRQTLALQLNDRSDYIGLLGSTEGIYPSAIPGRGIFKTDRTYEFQTAHMAEDDSQKAIRAFASGLAEKIAGRAKAVPALPDRVDCDLVRGRVLPESFPIGVEKNSLHLRTLNLTGSVVTLLLSQDACDLGGTAQGFAETLTLLPGTTVTVLDGLGVFVPDTGAPYEFISGSFEACISALFEEMVRRNHDYKAERPQGAPLPEYPARFYVIAGMAEILESLSEAGKDQMQTLIEKAEAAYNIRFLICGTAKSVSTLTLQPWYKRHVSGSDGIWAGDGISDQYVLKLGKISSDLYGELPTGFGYAVRRGRPVLIKLLTCRNGEEDAV